uniref:Xylulose kinase-1 n=1 Tax=Tanacetum cinerariifolium TaxID=118510 RepID=A0A699JUP4_TANCI|nr:hypothetical protein [Tanacetum cinerariifolium]
MSTPTFADTYNRVAFLEKPAQSARFEQIIDFLKSKPIHYALTVNPIIYVSCVKQFWAMTKVKKVNNQEQIQALVDKKKAIFEGLARMGAMASAIICLADNKKFNFSKKEVEVYHNESEDEDHVPTPSSDPLSSGDDSFTLNELMVFCTNLQEQVLDLQEAKDAQAKEIVALKKKVTKLNKWRKLRFIGLRRLKKIGSGKRVKSLMEKDGLGAHEDASKQRRMIKEINQDDEVALDDDTQGRTNDDEMFRVDDLAGEEVVMDTTTGEHKEQIIEDVSTAESVTTAGDVVTTTVKVSAAPKTDVTEDDITMAQALAALKSTKPKVVVKEQEMSTTIQAAATTVTTAVLTPRDKGIVFHKQKESQMPTVSSSKDKGKAKMIEPKVPIKEKD